MEQDRKLTKYIPLIAIDLFIIFSLLLFRFGTVEWLTPNTWMVVLFVLAVYVLFSVGYTITIVKSKPIAEEYIRCDFFKIARVMFLIGCSVMIVYYISNIIVVYGEHTLRFAQYPGASYDYQEYMQKLYSSGNGLEYPLWFRYITRVHTLLYGVVLSAIPLGVFYFGRLNIAERILLIATILVYAFRNWLVAAQMSFFMLLFIVATYYLYRLYVTINSAEQRKRLHRIILQTIILICTGVVCLLIVFIFQQDRQTQRNIRTKLNETMFESGYVMNDEIWGEIILRSINTRFNEEVFQIEYNGLEQSSDVGGAIPSSQLKKKLDSQAEYSEEKIEDLEMVGIDDYYRIKRDTSLLYKISPSVFYAIESIEIYQTQGYGALGLAFEHDFEWTFLVGNSKYLTTLVDRALGTSLAERTYVYKNEVVYGWSVTTFWQTLYTWLASDFTFIGVILLFGFVGALFAKVWLEVIRYKNPFGFSLMYIMIFGIIMASANNILFQDLGLLIGTLTIIFLFVLSCTIRKRRINKIINEKK